MRRGIINQNNRSGERERPGQDLAAQDGDESGPDEGRRVRQQCEEGEQRVGEGREGEEEAVAF